MRLRLHLPGPLDLRLTLRPLRRGPGDPTLRLGDGEAWRATRTPDGPATVHVRVLVGAVSARAWGAGAAYALEELPALLGLHDRPEDFRPRHRLLARLHRRMPGLRLGRTGQVIEALLPAILEQKVPAEEAHRTWRRLVLDYGQPAPGPAPLHVPPRPEELARLPYYLFHPLGIERRRAELIRGVCRQAARLEELGAGTPAEARHRLQLLPGVGPWTAGEVTALALGDPDAVSIGDYHLPHLVCWALAGQPRGDDRRMLELLEPYRGQRLRVLRLLEAGGLTAPRFGPRLPLRDIGRL